MLITFRLSSSSLHILYILLYRILKLKKLTINLNTMKKILFLLIAVCTFSLLSSETGCEDTPPTANSGVHAITTQITPGIDGKTAEQENISGRYQEDNKIGSIKYLYIISAYSGQVLIYSTVRGKVTSSGKRLTPTTVENGKNVSTSDNIVTIGGETYTTNEVLQDDGTYGNSIDYVYWFDTKGSYHQQYITGGMIMHISSQPIAVKSVVINMEETSDNK